MLNNLVILKQHATLYIYVSMIVEKENKEPAVALLYFTIMLVVFGLAQL